MKRRQCVNVPRRSKNGSLVLTFSTPKIIYRMNKHHFVAFTFHPLHYSWFTQPEIVSHAMQSNHSYFLIYARNFCKYMIIILLKHKTRLHTLKPSKIQWITPASSKIPTLLHINMRCNAFYPIFKLNNQNNNTVNEWMNEQQHEITMQTNGDSDNVRVSLREYESKRIAIMYHELMTKECAARRLFIKYHVSTTSSR